jgi:hypothetical protein
MVTATVTAIEPAAVDTNDNTLSKWDIHERTQNRAEYEYDRALYANALFNAGLDVVYMLGHILGKTAAEIKGDLENVKS